MSEEQAIGTARIDVVVDTSQLDIAVDRAKNRTASMSNAAQQEYAKLDRAEKRRVDRLIDQANTLNLTKEQQLAYNAALRTNSTLLDEIKRKIAQNTAAQNANGISAKQQAAALRGVPAQITDIFTSLQGGQRPITVLLQQGGQLKDMFGGIRPAVSALGSSLLRLVNPATAAAAAGVALVAAWNAAANESTAFNRGLIETGGYVGKTREQLQSLAAEMDGLQGVTTGSATAAIAAVVSTGRIAGSELESVSKAAAVWSDATGESVDSVVAKFVKLADDPVKAILELNKSQHFLTEETLKQIDALEKQGQHAEAVSLAIQTYSSVLIDRAPQMTEGLSNIEWAMRGLKNTAHEVADEIIGIFRASTNGSRIKELQSNIEAMQGLIGNHHWYNGGGVFGGLTDDQLRSQIAKAKAEQQRLGLFANVSGGVNAGNIVDNNQAAAEKAWDDYVKRFHTGASKLKDDIAEIGAMWKKAHPGGTDAQMKADKSYLDAVTDATEKYKKSLKKGSANTDDNSARTLLDSINRQIEANNQLAETGEKVSSSDRLVIQARQVLADKTNTMTASTRKLLEAIIPTLKASDDAAEKAQKEAKAKEQLARLNEQLANTEKNQQRSIEVDTMSLEHGGDASDILKRQLDIHRWYEDQVVELAKQAAREKRDVSKEEEEALQASRDKQLQADRDFQKNRVQIMADPMVGIRRATENYIANARDVASQVESIWGDAIQGMEDRMVDFLVTGKADWKGFLNDLASEIVHFMLKQAVIDFLKAFSSSGSGGSSSGGIWSQIATSILGAFTKNAMGGVYTSPSLSAYSGQVVSAPTMFAFAKGAGLMGEAGPEAIMPLARSSDGKLGIRVTGGGGVNVNVGLSVNVDNSGGASSDDERAAALFGQKMKKEMETTSRRVINEEQRPGGSLWKMQHA